MKRIFNLIWVALCVIGYTSCSNDEGIEYIQQSSIKIISRDVSFPAMASQGSLVVEAPGDITVTTSDKGWCTTSVSGSTIQINVEPNNGLDGRSSMLTIRCGDDEARVAIVQSGVVFELPAGSQVTGNDEVGTYLCDVKCNSNMTFNPSDDWISAVFEDGKIHITLQENNTGHMRKGHIVCMAGPLEDVITVKQCDFDKDFAGACSLVYTDETTGQEATLDATLNKVDDTYSLAVPSLSVSIPLIYNKATASLVLKAGAQAGSVSSMIKIYTVLLDSEGVKMWRNTASMTGEFDYVEEGGVGHTVAVFRDDGSWGTNIATTVNLEKYVFSAGTMFQGIVKSLPSPYLRK